MASSPAETSSAPKPVLLGYASLRRASAGLASRERNLSDLSQVIDSHLERVSRALEHSDLELAIGSAKEICETVALAVCHVVGRDDSVSRNYPKLVATAHQLLGRDPARQPRGSIEQQILERGRAVAIGLGELRNSVGTGHGRLETASVPLDIALIAVNVSIAWATWATVRLADALGHSVIEILESADQHELMSALESTVLVDLLEPAQFQVGVIVGRALHGSSFKVRHDLVRVPALSTDYDTWPASYRAGLVHGLLTTADGLLAVDELSVELIGDVLRNGDDSEGPVVAAFLRTVDDAVEIGLGPELLTEGSRQAVLKAVRTQLAVADRAVAVAWARVENRLLE